MTVRRIPESHRQSGAAPRRADAARRAGSQCPAAMGTRAERANRLQQGDVRLGQQARAHRLDHVATRNRVRSESGGGRRLIRGSSSKNVPKVAQKKTEDHGADGRTVRETKPITSVSAAKARCERVALPARMSMKARPASQALDEAECTRAITFARRQSAFHFTCGLAGGAHVPLVMKAVHGASPSCTGSLRGGGFDVNTRQLSGRRTHACLCCVQTDCSGCVKSGSPNAPRATPIRSGIRAGSHQMLDPQRVQKWNATE